MAGGGGHKPPYLTSLVLYGWAKRNWNTLDGRLLTSSGFDLRTADLARLCNISYATQASLCADQSELDKLDQSLRPEQIEREMRRFEQRERQRRERTATPALPAAAMALMGLMQMEQR